jgi:hypothetical protein
MEDEALGLDEALARGLARIVKFLGASKLDATAIREPLLRRCACSSQESRNRANSHSDIFHNSIGTLTIPFQVL